MVTLDSQVLGHWKRCLRRKVQELDLVKVINHNQEVAKWVRSWSVMQLVCVEEIQGSYMGPNFRKGSEFGPRGKIWSE